MVLEEMPNLSIQAEEGKVLQNKRKPFVTLPVPDDVSDKSEIFVMPGTNEIFKDYDAYSKRLDDLKLKKYVDSVNGKTGLNFFDALASEKRSSTAAENVFPNVLRDHILRKVQFAQTSRMDELVNKAFDYFKHEFFPGEDVKVDLPECTEPQDGVIREKASFPNIKGPDGEIQRPSFARYFVATKSGDTKDALVDYSKLRRDRKVFTKQNLRHFLKHSLQREAWIGAPWLVKEPLAIKYRLPMEIPAHLLQDARLLANNVHCHPVDLTSLITMPKTADAPQQQMLNGKAPRARQKKNSEAMRAQHEAQMIAQLQQQVSHGLERATRELQLTLHQNPGVPLEQLLQLHQLQPPQQTRTVQPPAQQEVKPPQPPAPTIKYPIEDVDVPPKRKNIVRPQLQFFTPEHERYIKQRGRPHFEDVTMEALGHLLDIWDLLNVQCETYKLDSFTFDDFVDAMRYQSPDISCELFEEMHCSVLTLLVNTDGKVQLIKGALHEVIPDDSDSSDDEQDDSEISTPLPDAPARSTRSSMRLSHVDPAVQNPRSPTTPPEKPNRAAELLGDRDWVARIAERDYRDGGWQVIVAGILHHITAAYPPTEKRRKRAERILASLVPVEIEPTQENTRLQYAKMDINLRASALQIVSRLSVQTVAVRDGLDSCNEDMTQTRKDKSDHQKNKKIASEEIQAKEREKRVLMPEEPPVEAPPRRSSGVDSTNGSIDDTAGEINGVESQEGDTEAVTNGRALRRANDRKRKREEDAARQAEEKLKKAKMTKEVKQYQKLCAEIEDLQKQIEQADEAILECDSNLREADVQRSRAIGQDRYCNTYWWFEHNGQPYFGLPTSSTSHYGYANGRLWVQGPSEEMRAIVEYSEEQQEQYRRRMGLTVPERRRIEEGETMLCTADEWGYYGEPEALEELIMWLDDRGLREKQLKRELLKVRGHITETMVRHKKFKDEEAAKKLEAEGEAGVGGRVATRGKAQEDQMAKERCLKWTNETAKDSKELGHLHSRPPKSKKKAAKETKPAKGVAIPLNRKGKPVTRQGL